jgi:hypothetical protein
MHKYRCHRKECTIIRNEYSFFSNRKRLPLYEGNLFCSESCLWTFFEKELGQKWRRLQVEQDRKIPRPRLGTILMKTAFLTREQLEEAIRLQNQTRKGRIGEWLLHLGFVEEHQITAALAQQSGLPLINLKNSNPSNEAVHMVPGKVAKCVGLIPVGYDDNQSSIRIAVSGPVNFLSQEAIRRMVHKGIETYMGDESTIQQLLERWYDPEDLDLGSAPKFSSLEDLIDIGSEIISTAVKQRALDIKAELGHEFFWVRLDFTSELHHYIYRFVSDAHHLQEAFPMGDAPMAYAMAQ